MSEKNLYIIGGCNGAGKTTASYTILPEILDCREFVNSDEIARGLSPFNPNSMTLEAGKLMLKRIKELLGREESFAIETTLATRSYINLVRQAQAKNYVVTLVFFWLRTPELALQRIAERVKNGGHDIPPATARRRYIAGITNLFNIYIPEVNYWSIYDNSESPRIIIARGGKQLDSTIYEENVYNKLITLCQTKKP
ncbi:MAG: zeta toxin family protein [Bacteroidales bacterium]|nr:zeta toxin family protein [Bacteroidales bacterium]